MSVKLRPNRPRQQAGEQPVAEHVAAAIGLRRLVLAGADDHVELLVDQHRDHLRRGLGIVGQVAVGHDIDVGIDVGEHAADDMALALLPLGADDRAGRRARSRACGRCCCCRRRRWWRRAARRGSRRPSRRSPLPHCSRAAGRRCAGCRSVMPPIRRAPRAADPCPSTREVSAILSFAANGLSSSAAAFLAASRLGARPSGLGRLGRGLGLAAAFFGRLGRLRPSWPALGFASALAGSAFLAAAFLAAAFLAGLASAWSWPQPGPWTWPSSLSRSASSSARVDRALADLGLARRGSRRPCPRTAGRAAGRRPSDPAGRIGRSARGPSAGTAAPPGRSAGSFPAG